MLLFLCSLLPLLCLSFPNPISASDIEPLDSGHVNLIQATRTANLTSWPPAPFSVRIVNHLGARIQFYKTYAIGTHDHAEQAQRLIAGEINYLETHVAAVGPKDISVEANFTTIWLGCHAWLSARSRWTHAFAIDMLRSLQGWIWSNGFQEGEFDVTGQDQGWLATCRLLMHVPYPGNGVAVDVA